MRASKEFNLTLTAFEDDDSDTGIWDGQNFVLVVSCFWYKFAYKNLCGIEDRKWKLSEKLVGNTEGVMEVWLHRTQ
jgi:hypothetical protein